MDIAAIVDFLKQAVMMVLHFDQHLNAGMAYFGPWMYLILFLIIFCETGLVVTPILPGDSLLFALGALCSRPDSVLNVYLLWALLIIAAILGDAVNYAIGFRLGPKVFQYKGSRFFNPDHLQKAHSFYEKYGAKTIVFARFMPIVRTFAPFVAGIARMSYAKFAMYNVVGAFVWITSLLFAGYYFGNLPIIQKNFHVVIFMILILSVLPGLIEWYRVKSAKA